MKIIAWNINGIRSSMKTNELYELIEVEKLQFFLLFLFYQYILVFSTISIFNTIIF